MSHRSTRNKLRWQAQKASECQTKALEHLRYLDELAAGQSPVINNTMPFLVQGITKVKEALDTFREHL